MTCTNYLEINDKMRPSIRIYYSSVSYCSTCFEQHIAHHQEPKNCICSLWFTYVCDCQQLSRQQIATTDVCKPEAANTVFGLLMMGDMSLETCWAIRSTGIINSNTWSHLVGYFYIIYIMMHRSMNIKKNDMHKSH
jgi:hypothetical protein